MPAPSGELQLPLRPLDALPLMPKQVEEWLEQMLHQPSAPWLVAIDGTPGREGGTFLYAATPEAPSERGDQLWLQPGIAAAALGANDNRLLLLCAGA